MPFDNETRTKLKQYGGKLLRVDGRKTVQLVDPTDNARRRFQYRAALGGGLEKRMLRPDGERYPSGSPWEPYSAFELASLLLQRGQWHPILDPLGL